MAQAKSITADEAMLKLCDGLQALADRELGVLNGRIELFPDGRSSIDFWRSWKEHWVKQAQLARQHNLPPP